MATRTLKSAPRILPLYARAAAPLVPGASRLPFVGGGGGELPELELELEDVRIDRERLAAYAHVCGFSLRDALPATFPHVLAFPLHLALMTDSRFPFGAIGLVHLSNRIVQHRPIDSAETLGLRVRLTPLRAHRGGRTFAIVSEARVAGELVWEDHSTMLRRERPSEPAESGGSDAAESLARAPAESAESPARGPAEPLASAPAESLASAPAESAGGDAGREQPVARQSAVWNLPGDLGRRFAGVSGDRNPIHMHALSAKLFGFPRAIAHGMWTKARCLAALERELPDAFAVAVDFRKPILLPGEVAFGAEAARDSSDPGHDGGMRFAVWSRGGGVRHLDGLLERPGGAA
jgi:acyl dehydratase